MEARGYFGGPEAVVPGERDDGREVRPFSPRPLPPKRFFFLIFFIYLSKQFSLSDGRGIAHGKDGYWDFSFTLFQLHVFLLFRECVSTSYMLSLPGWNRGEKNESEDWTERKD